MKTNFEQWIWKGYQYVKQKFLQLKPQNTMGLSSGEIRRPKWYQNVVKFSKLFYEIFQLLRWPANNPFFFKCDVGFQTESYPFHAPDIRHGKSQREKDFKRNKLLVASEENLTRLGNREN